MSEQITVQDLQAIAAQSGQALQQLQKALGLAEEPAGPAEALRRRIAGIYAGIPPQATAVTDPEDSQLQEQARADAQHYSDGVGILNELVTAISPVLQRLGTILSAALAAAGVPGGVAAAAATVSDPAVSEPACQLRDRILPAAIAWLQQRVGGRV